MGRKERLGGKYYWPFPSFTGTMQLYLAFKLLFCIILLNPENNVEF
jgi:hypothetical protein